MDPQYISVAVACVLQGCILRGLLRGGARRFPLFLGYLVVTAAGTLVNASVLLRDGRWTQVTAKIYWICDGAAHLAGFLAVAGLLWGALDRGEQRSRAMIHAGGAAALYLFFAFALSWDARPNLWLTAAMRNVSFGAMLMALITWLALLRRPDPARLLLCAGFGIGLASSAIGHSLRQLSPQLVTAGNLCMVGGYLASLEIWRRAVRLQPAPAAAPGPAPASEPAVRVFEPLGSAVYSESMDPDA